MVGREYVRVTTDEPHGWTRADPGRLQVYGGGGADKYLSQAQPPERGARAGG